SIASGQLIRRQPLRLPAGAEVVSLAQDQPGSRRLALGLSDGQVLVVEHQYRVSYPNNVRQITPELVQPYGEQPIRLAPKGVALEQLALSVNGERLLLAGSDAEHNLHVLGLEREENLLTGQVSVQQARIELAGDNDPVRTLLLDPRQQWLYVIRANAEADVFDLRQRTLNGRYPLLDEPGNRITATASLLGGISLLIGDAQGQIHQWFMVREPERASLRHVRSFQLGDQPITQILPEERRKGFLAIDEAGTLGVFHSTAHRTVLIQPLQSGAVLGALSPRASLLLTERDGVLRRFDLDNPHPEVSWSALWDKVWYENYPEPDYVWQSTSANTDFEPKLSLAPLAFGTLKAALYAMLLAAPLAIAAAIYTAYFMAPRLRGRIKPVIELMEALPTVILGFFAGLFLAPFLESHLPGIFSLLLLTPAAILGFAYLWSRAPQGLRRRVPEGWESVLLIPVILLVGWGALAVSGHLENWFFGGNMREWLTHDLGI